VADMQSIQERMKPTHLIREDNPDPEIPSDEDLKKKVEAAALPEEPKADPDKPDPRGEKKYTFTLDYKDARGKIWKGQFTNKILSIHERQQVGVMRSMLGAGQPLPSLDPLTVELNLIVAHMTYSLTEKPDWAANLRSLEDPQLLQEIYMEVDSHESYFLGWGTNQSEG
jgi:hypothetical protein